MGGVRRAHPDLAERLAADDIDLVVGVARTGLLAATAVARAALRPRAHPAHAALSDAVVHESPVWKAPVPAAVSCRVVAIVDDMSDTGETLCVAAEAVRGAGARRIVTAGFAAHTWAVPPLDVAALTSEPSSSSPGPRRFGDGHWRTTPT